MTNEVIREILSEIDENILVADGFDDAIIGYVEGCGRTTVALYDTEKCIEILMAEGLTHSEACEHFDYNVMGSYVGEYTPMFATILRDN